MADRRARHTPETSWSSSSDFSGFVPQSYTSDEGEYGEIQILVNELFASQHTASNLDLIAAADVHDVGYAVREVVDLLPSGPYTRAQMVDQLNSIITAHGWSTLVGTVA